MYYLEFDKLRHFLESLAKKIGGNLTDSHLTLSVKYYHYLKEVENTAIFSLLRFLNKPTTISQFLKLIAI